MDKTGENKLKRPRHLAKAAVACSSGVEVAEGEQLACLRRPNRKEEQGRGCACRVSVVGCCGAMTGE